MKSKKKEALDRRRFLTKAATVGGAGLAGVILMGGLDRSVLAGPNPNQTAIISKWSQEMLYDWIIFTDGTNYYAKNGNTGKIDVTNTTPDIWALLNSINALAASSDVTSIYIMRGQYTGTATFSPSVDKGYHIVGSGGLSMFQHAAANNPLLLGTVLSFTASTGSAIDTSNWNTSPNLHPAQQLICEHFTIYAPNTNCNNTAVPNGKGVIDLPGCNCSYFFDFGISGNSTAVIAKSSGMRWPTLSNQMKHMMYYCQVLNFDLLLNLGADHVTINSCEFESYTTYGIYRGGGGDVLLVDIHCYQAFGGGANPFIVDASTAPDTYIKVRGAGLENSNSGVFKSLNNAPYIIDGLSNYQGKIWTDHKANSQNELFAVLAADYTTATTANDVSTGVGVSPFTYLAVTAINTGQISIRGTIQASNNTITNGIIVKVYRSTVAIPTQGNAPAGGDVVIWSGSYTQEGLGGNPQSFAFDFIDSNLSGNNFAGGAQFFYYITIAAVTGGTAKIIGNATATNATTIRAVPV